ncbi:MAG TPA: hypothetical protein VJL58_07215 [Pyrinomonadaceae bacterium]|nr:hypothetical protein [Pyrinomonadaceae bacterium]
MNKAYVLIGLILALSVSSFGQKQKTKPDSDDSVRASSSSKASGKSDTNADLGHGMLAAGTSLEGQLQNAIDVRKSKVGDEIVVKTTKAIKQNGEVIVPKGANLIGRITEVKRKAKDDSTSRVGMIFDRIQGKNLDMPISASIVSVLTAQANAAAGDLFSTDVAGSSSTSGRASTSSSGGSGGGLLGGVGSTVGGIVNTTTSTVGHVAGTATNTVGNTVGSTTGTVARTVNGLQISQSASGSASSSSTISANGKDVKIDKGATFLLRVDGSVSQN